MNHMMEDMKVGTMETVDAMEQVVDARTEDMSLTEMAVAAAPVVAGAAAMAAVASAVGEAWDALIEEVFLTKMAAAAMPVAAGAAAALVVDSVAGAAWDTMFGEP